MQKDKSGSGKKSYVFEIVRALILALAITLFAVLAAAILIKALNVPTKFIGIINQVIKGVAIFVSALVCLRLPGCGFIRGAILGLIYILLSFVAFSLLGGGFKFDITLLNDAILGATSGLISGIIAVNIRK